MPTTPNPQKTARSFASEGIEGLFALDFAVLRPAHGISRSSFYNLKAAGKAPREMRVGSRVLISAEAAADWRRTMEADATREAAHAQTSEAGEAA